MDMYLLEIEKMENRSKVLDILNFIFSTDLLSETIAYNNIKHIKPLKDIGENKVYAIIVEELKELPFYKDLL